MKLFSQNPDFYPTPERVIAQMMIGEDILGKRVLEPSAGSGNIVRWLKRNGAQDVIACEKDPHLRKLLDGQCRLIAEDFLQVSADEVSHVDYIVMNPPFSRGAEHILHAYEIAPDNCTIIALCNTSNLSGRSYSRTNNVLAETVKLHGSREDLGCCFEDDAERTTRVEVSLLKLYKQGSGDSEFADYFFSAYDEDDLSGSGKEGLMSYNFVRDIVNRYVSAVKLFDSVLAASKEINDLADFYDYKTVTDPHTGEQKQERNSYGSVPVRFGAIVVKDDERLASEGTAITHDQYKKALQKHYWKIIFSKLHMEKYATAQLRDQINKFVEQQTNVPFTMKNIYRVIDIVIQTNGQRMQRALTEAFDTICSFSAENSTAGETWKTNANYMVNRKFIVPYIVSVGWNCTFEVDYSDYVHRKCEMIEDVVKALCTITGRDYDTIGSLRRFIYNNRDKIKFGEWFEWGFFRCKGFKKGTMHFEFIDEDVWYKFNYECARLRGWNLPKKTQKTRMTKKTA